MSLSCDFSRAGGAHLKSINLGCQVPGIPRTVLRPWGGDPGFYTWETSAGDALGAELLVCRRG